MIDLKEKEEVIEIVKKSFFIVLPSLLLGLLFSLPSIAILYFDFNAILNIIAFVWLIVVLSYVFYHVLNWHYDAYIITNLRVVEVKNKGVFSKQFIEMPIDRIENSKCKIKGIFPTIFGYGTVEIYALSNLNLIVENIPEPMRIQSLISEIRENILKK